MHAKEKAWELIQRYNTRDPFVIAEYLRITVVFADLDDEIGGMFQRYKSHFIIHINQRKNRQEQRTNCAHELGHALMHEELNLVFLSTMIVDSTAKLERQAWEFAAELLIPDELPVEYAGITYKQLASLIGCPEFLMNYKTFPTMDGPEFY